MPRLEIDEILRTDDPLLIHWYLELHRERLEERLAEQRRRLPVSKRPHEEVIPAWSLIRIQQLR